MHEISSRNPIKHGQIPRGIRQMDRRVCLSGSLLEAMYDLNEIITIFRGKHTMFLIHFLKKQKGILIHRSMV